jgi:hypothetical protein
VWILRKIHSAVTCGPSNSQDKAWVTDTFLQLFVAHAPEIAGFLNNEVMFVATGSIFNQ